MPSIQLRDRRAPFALAALTVAVAGAAIVITAAPSVAAANCGAGYVGLTYDDGPNPPTTTALLNALTAAGARATFFNVGQKVQQNQSLTRAQQQAGMWIANHSWTHAHLTQLSVAQMTAELSQTQQAIQQATGAAPRLFRPPYGETNATLRSVEAQLGLTEVLWSVDSQDWNGASTAQIVQAASTLQNGGVILMHDGYQSTINAIPQIMANLASRNLYPGMISPSTGRAVAPDGAPPTSPQPSSPPPSSPRPPSPSVSPPPAGAGSCTATYRETARWGDRFNGEVTIRAGDTAITSWTATSTVRSPQRVSAVWNGTPSWDASGNVMTVRPAGNGSLPAGGSTTFGFTVMANGVWTAPTVTCRVP